VESAILLSVGRTRQRALRCRPRGRSL